jgi:hypothetical protein
VCAEGTAAAESAAVRRVGLIAAMAYGESPRDQRLGYAVELGVAFATGLIALTLYVLGLPTLWIVLGGAILVFGLGAAAFYFVIRDHTRSLHDD